MTRLLNAARTATRIGAWSLQLAGLVAVVDGVWRESVPGALVLAGVLAVAVVELVDRGAK